MKTLFCEWTILSGSYKRTFLFNPNRFIWPLINGFRLFPSFPVYHSFACRHIVCLILST